MRILIGTYDVEIKARNRARYVEEFNDLDVETLLNEVSLWAGKAAEVDKDDTFFGPRARMASMDIYDFLRERGFYDEKTSHIDAKKAET